MKPVLPVALLTVSIALATASPDALATSRTRVFWHAAISSCDASDPSFDVMLLREVSALRNNGTEVVTVTCGTMTDVMVADGQMTQVTLYVYNHRLVDVAMKCTLHADRHAIARQIVVGAGGPGTFTWTPADYGGYTYAAIVCDLPARMSVRDLAVTYQEDVGQ